MAANFLTILPLGDGVCVPPFEHEQLPNREKQKRNMTSKAKS
jgi:hypothetical protein